MINYASDEAQGSCAEGRIRYHFFGPTLKVLKFNNWEESAAFVITPLNG